MSTIDLRGERWQEVYTKIDLANEIRRLRAREQMLVNIWCNGVTSLLGDYRGEPVPAADDPQSMVQLEALIARYEREDAIKAAANATLLEEVKRLSARVEELEQERLHTLTKHFEQIIEMTYREDKVEKDAARYRWLRDGGADNSNIGVYEWAGTDGSQRRIWLARGELDSAIDAAMEGKK